MCFRFSLLLLFLSSGIWRVDVSQRVGGRCVGFSRLHVRRRRVPVAKECHAGPLGGTLTRVRGEVASRFAVCPLDSRLAVAKECHAGPW